MEQVWEILKAGPTMMLAGALVYVTRQLQSVSRRNDKLIEQLQAVQEQRVKDSQANTTAMLAVAERVHAFADKMSDLIDRVEDLLNRRPR